MDNTPEEKIGMETKPIGPTLGNSESSGNKHSEKQNGQQAEGESPIDAG